MPETKPPLRILHQLSRSGGTLLAKCLASMTGVALLSEVHPQAPRFHGHDKEPWGASAYNPLAQARAWYGLAGAAEAEAAPGNDEMAAFREAISLIARRGLDKGLHLVVRDYNHMDFTGFLRQAQPPYRFLSAEALSPVFDLRRFCTVRHPLPQAVSLQRFVDRRRFDVSRFMAGYRRFAETARRIGYLRFEDFTADPQTALRELCARLKLDYDPGWEERWREYRAITGDPMARRGLRDIGDAPQGDIAPELIAAIEANEDYRRALELLGYRHPKG